MQIGIEVFVARLFLFDPIRKIWITSQILAKFAGNAYILPLKMFFSVGHSIWYWLDKKNADLELSFFQFFYQSTSFQKKFITGRLPVQQRIHGWNCPIFCEYQLFSRDNLNPWGRSTDIQLRTIFFAYDYKEAEISDFCKKSNPCAV